MNTQQTPTEKLLPNQIIKGYTSIDRPLEVKDYPYGFKLRTSIFYWIESKAGAGDRLGTYTINPKTGRPNKPKYSTYSPFMYLFTDDNGHVKTGEISAYDREEFEMRFGFIINKITEFYISDIQKNNLRANYYQHCKYAAPYEIVKFSEERKQLYKEWITAKLKYISSCPFAELVDFPQARPVEDNPTGEVKMIVTEYQPKN